LLTDSQNATLKAAMLAETDPQFVEWRNTGNNGGMMNFYNEIASPAFTAWKSRVTMDEIMTNGFDWVLVDNLSVGKARIWEWLFNNEQRSLNASKANVRLGIDECWKGTAAMLAQREAIYVHCKRFTTRGEKVLATGTGTDADPAVMSFEGAFNTDDVRLALAS
jgi:hypothetical protein